MRKLYQEMASSVVGWVRAAVWHSLRQPRKQSLSCCFGAPSIFHVLNIKPKYHRNLSSRAGPPKVATDEVIPMQYFDDTSMTRGMIMSYTMKFNEILDANKLHTALSRLLELGDWRKMGGRLRLNKSGKLDIHIPRPFTPERPAVRYSHVELDTSIEDHSLASKIPTRMDNPSLQAGAEDFRPLSCREGVPTRIQDYLYSDEPQIQLHIVSFNDATLVSLSWPHTMTDVMGRQAFLKAWNLVLAGKEDQVPPFLSIKEDPLAELGHAKSSNPYLFESLQLKGMKMLHAVARYVLTAVIWPTNETRMIFLPSKTIRSLHKQALSQLPPTDVNGNKTFVSEGDVLTAWAAQTTCQNISRKSKRNVLILNVFDLRSRLPILFRPGGVYVQNASFPCLTMLSVNKLLKSSLGDFALYLRQSILDQVAEKQVRALAYLLRQAYDKTNNPPFFGAPNSFPIFFTNWSKGKFFEIVDFSPAVVKTGQTSEENARPGKPMYFHSQLLGKGFLTARNAFNILGKDGEGNYWMTGILHPEVWANFEKEIVRLKEVETIDANRQS